MVKAADAAIKEVWEREPKEPREEGVKAVVFAHFCNAYARRGKYGSTETTD
tara:strand:- start:2341 stop:2493 length:153 start_codon:yes stop_codon:yes gene_type:complete